MRCLKIMTLKSQLFSDPANQVKLIKTIYVKPVPKGNIRSPLRTINAINVSPMQLVMAQI